MSGRHMDNVRRETPAVSVMIERLDTDAIRDKKDNRPLLHEKRRHRLTERNHQKVQVAEERDHQEQEAEISSGESVRTRVWIRMQVWRQMSDTLRLMGSPVKVEEKWCKGSVALLKESMQMGCVSQDSRGSLFD